MCVISATVYIGEDAFESMGVGSAQRFIGDVKKAIEVVVGPAIKHQRIFVGPKVFDDYYQLDDQERVFIDISAPVQNPPTAGWADRLSKELADQLRPWFAKRRLLQGYELSIRLTPLVDCGGVVIPASGATSPN